MKLTLTVLPAARAAALAEFGHLVPGDVLDPLVLDFSETGEKPESATVSLRRDGPSGDVVATAECTREDDARPSILVGGCALPPELCTVPEPDSALGQSAPSRTPDYGRCWLTVVSAEFGTHVSCPVPVLAGRMSDV